MVRGSSAAGRASESGAARPGASRRSTRSSPSPLLGALARRSPRSACHDPRVVACGPRAGRSSNSSLVAHEGRVLVGDPQEQQLLEGQLAVGGAVRWRREVVARIDCRGHRRRGPGTPSSKAPGRRPLASGRAHPRGARPRRRGRRFPAREARSMARCRTSWMRPMAPTSPALMGRSGRAAPAWTRRCANRRAAAGSARRASARGEEALAKVVAVARFA